MSCCREIPHIESIWLKDDGPDSLVVRHVLVRFPGDHDDHAVFYKESGGLQWYAWFAKDDVGQYTDVHVGFRYTTEPATAAAIDDFGGGATSIYRICSWNQEDEAWEVDDEGGIPVIVPGYEGILDEMLPFGITILAPMFRSWWPVGTENGFDMTYAEASNPETVITMNFHCVPFDPEGEESDVEMTFRYLGINAGGTDDTLEFESLATGGGASLETDVVLVTPKQFVYQADEAPLGDTPPTGTLPVRLAISFSQCRINDSPTDVRLATLAMGGDIPMVPNLADFWCMAIYSAWAGQWTPVSVQGADTVNFTSVQRYEFRPCDRSAFPRHVTYYASTPTFGTDIQYITVTGFSVETPP